MLSTLSIVSLVAGGDVVLSDELAVHARHRDTMTDHCRGMHAEVAALEAAVRWTGTGGRCTVMDRGCGMARAVRLLLRGTTPSSSHVSATDTR